MKYRRATAVHSSQEVGARISSPRLYHAAMTTSVFAAADRHEHTNNTFDPVEDIESAGVGAQVECALGLGQTEDVEAHGQQAAENHV